MKRLIAIFLLFLLIGCKLNTQEIIIPDNYTVTDITKKIRFEKTRVLLNIDSSYKFNEELHIYQKSNNYIKIIEIPNQSYLQVSPKLIHKMVELERQGGVIRIKKTFRLGDYEAYFAIAPQGLTDQIMLVFGDESFSVMVIGVCENVDSIRKEMVDIILSAYINKSLKVSFEEQLNYSINLTNSDFKLCSSISNIGIYSHNGIAITNDNWMQDYLMVSTFPAQNNIDLSILKDKLIEDLENNTFEEKRIKIKIIKEDKLEENEQKSLSLITKGYVQTKEIMIFILFCSSPEGIIRFVGLDFSNGKSINKYKEISNTIKIK